jgi:hypothetical protein
MFMHEMLDCLRNCGDCGRSDRVLTVMKVKLNYPPDEHVISRCDECLGHYVKWGIKHIERMEKLGTLNSTVLKKKRQKVPLQEFSRKELLHLGLIGVNGEPDHAAYVSVVGK